jgi:copper homeostasis protein
VIHTGADCLLTSGGAHDVLAGADSIARLRGQAAGRLEIMAGGGLKLTNLAEVVRRTGVSYLHGSLTRRNANPMQSENGEANGKQAGNGHSAVDALLMLEADVRESIRLLRQEVNARESAVQATR